MILPNILFYDVEFETLLKAEIESHHKYDLGSMKTDISKVFSNIIQREKRLVWLNFCSLSALVGHLGFSLCNTAEINCGLINESTKKIKYLFTFQVKFCLYLKNLDVFMGLLTLRM